MKYAYAIILGLGSALVAMTLATLPAQAAGLKTFVTIFGNDGNDCLTGVAACRTAQRGVDQADPGGEVVFDSRRFFHCHDHQVADADLHSRGPNRSACRWWTTNSKHPVQS